MKIDVQIDQELKLKHIHDLSDTLTIERSQVELYGNHKAKLSLSLLEREQKGKVILITSINPTPAGEGKTTVNIGLSMALNKIGESAISALREPSLGPCFGIKGTATGGGYSQVHPMVDINLHFTGDFHAITAAHNLLAAMIDNHIFHGNELNIDPNQITWNRVMDMNDRALRSVEIKTRKTKFDIAVTSEIMAILCLAEDFNDLRERLSRIVVAYTYDNKPISPVDIKAVGALMLLLKDALRPNLVQTSEATPAIIHGGPFANIAHGCNSVIATKMSMGLADYVITEAGFGADLGAEKFFDIKCRSANIKPEVVVLVATIKALKYHGGCKLRDLENENIELLTDGLKHLKKHVDNLRLYGVPVIIAINQFPSDTDLEIEVLRNFSKKYVVPISFTDVHLKGGEGAIDLANQVIKLSKEKSDFKLLYDNEGSIKKTIFKIANKIYGASSVDYTDKALIQLSKINNQNLPVCIAKTQYSFTDNPKKRNVAKDFSVEVKSMWLAQGAGFVVVLLGDIMTMPGLPKHPNAEKMDVLDDLTVIGLK